MFYKGMLRLEPPAGTLLPGSGGARPVLIWPGPARVGPAWPGLGQPGLGWAGPAQ